MPTQSSGPISFADLNTFLGTNQPLSFNQIYRGGTYVPDITPNDHVPTGGRIDMQEMYDTWANKSLSFTINVGSVAVPRKGFYFGYGIATKGGTFGSISQSSFLTPSGPMTIEGLYYSTTTHAWHLHLSAASAPANNDLSFRSVSITGYSINGVRASATSTQTPGINSRRWNWVVKSTNHPTSGTINCVINYYG